MHDSATVLLESDLSQSLLDSLPEPAFLLDREHRIRGVNRAYRRRFSAWGTVVGRRCFEVLHRRSLRCGPEVVDCPLRECSVRGRTVHCLHVHDGPVHEEHQRVSVHPLRRQDGEVLGFLQVLRDLPAASAVADSRRLVGRSPAFLQMLDALRRASESVVSILLQGETGSGRRLAGETIHRLGNRRHGPLRVLDASGFSEAPAESWAATGSSALDGWTESLEAARGGTLLIHEVGKLPRPFQSDLQARLSGAAVGDPERDGGVEGDFRLVCTTSRDLGTLEAEGALLPELQRSLGLMQIRVPPLRERMEDLSLLIDSLLLRHAERGVQELDPEAREMLAGYCFPGNVSELGQLLRRASLLAEGETIGREHLKAAWGGGQGVAENPRLEGGILPLEEAERRYLEWAVRTFSGSKAELAERLGIAERTLYRKLRALRILHRESDA